MSPQESTPCFPDDSVIRHGILDAEFPFRTKPFTKQSLLDPVSQTLRQRRAAI